MSFFVCGEQGSSPASTGLRTVTEGRARPHPVGETGRAKEWQSSKNTTEPWRGQCDWVTTTVRPLWRESLITKLAHKVKDTDLVSFFVGKE